MRKALKKARILKAYQLGVGSPVEKQLIDEGAIVLLPNGKYKLFSQEVAEKIKGKYKDNREAAKNGEGEDANPLDYYKYDDKDGIHYPYPNDKAWFEKRHIKLDEKEYGPDTYKQPAEERYIWEAGDDPECEEMKFLLNNGRLILNENDPGHYFNAVIRGADESSPKDAVILIFNVTRDKDTNAITDIDFNFIQRFEFERDYESID